MSMLRIMERQLLDNATRESQSNPRAVSDYQIGLESNFKAQLSKVIQECEDAEKEAQRAILAEERSKLQLAQAETNLRVAQDKIKTLEMQCRDHETKYNCLEEENDTALSKKDELIAGLNSRVSDLELRARKAELELESTTAFKTEARQMLQDARKVKAPAAPLKPEITYAVVYDQLGRVASIVSKAI